MQHPCYAPRLTESRFSDMGYVVLSRGSGDTTVRYCWLSKMGYVWRSGGSEVDITSSQERSSSLSARPSTPNPRL